MHAWQKVSAAQLAAFSMHHAARTTIGCSPELQLPMLFEPEFQLPMLLVPVHAIGPNNISGLPSYHIESS
jgi:hypothetical protein